MERKSFFFDSLYCTFLFIVNFYYHLNYSAENKMLIHLQLNTRKEGTEKEDPIKLHPNTDLWCSKSIKHFLKILPSWLIQSESLGKLTSILFSSWCHAALTWAWTWGQLCGEKSLYQLPSIINWSEKPRYNIESFFY